MRGGGHPFLVVVSGKTPGRRFPLKNGSCVIGRDPDVEIPVEEQRISRRHAELIVRDGLVMIKDLKSTNGVFVNDFKVVGSPLKDGDIIQIGTTVFKFIADGGENPPE